jgi:hypothetical protein
MSKTILQHPSAATRQNKAARAASNRRHGVPQKPEQWEKALIASVIPDHRCYALADYMENRGRELRLDRQTYKDLAKRGWTRGEVNRTISRMAANERLIENGWDDGVVVFHLLTELGGVSADGVDAL